MSYRDRLIGTWFLESFTGTAPDGSVVHIMGADASGFISYTEDGWVSVEIIKAGRPRYSIPDTELGSDEETLACARGIFAYAGEFEVDEDSGIVFHNLKFSLIPNWIGSSQKRYIHLSDDGMQLELTSDPCRMGQNKEKLSPSLKWKRKQL
jgi:hypothetical protein